MDLPRVKTRLTQIWPRFRTWLANNHRRPSFLTGLFAIFWLALWIDAHLVFLLRPLHHALGFALALPICFYWARYWKKRSEGLSDCGEPSPLSVPCEPSREGPRRDQKAPRQTGAPAPATPGSSQHSPRCRIIYRAVLSVSFLPLWQFLAALPLVFSAYDLANQITQIGTVTAFLIGLAWATWAVDLQTKRTPQPERSDKPLWNPFQLIAWYFGRRNRKLRQSMLTLLVYTFLFSAIFLIITNMTGCSIYESPIGGGEEKQLKQLVKIQKVIRKKFVINPYSSIIFNPPPIDDVKLQILEQTEHLYMPGQGKGEGAGFSAGTARGKVRFIRLKYDGGDWQQDMDRGSDLNLLTEYGVRLGHKVNDRPEPMEIRRLKSFPARKSPPMVYMTGQQGISVGEGDIKILREYLLDKHGMLFADNGGSSGWEGQFVGMMRKVLPRVEPISVYLDHPIHRIPYPLPKLPYVAKHGSANALGWVVDGRLAVYYHPGDIGDAWADGHSGVPREVWESCFQLGVNVIFYAHAEYNKWIEATNEAK